MVAGLGERLKKQRELKNLSQKEAAAAIGVSAGVMSNYENSERTPSVEALLALARLYNCSTDYLLGFTKDKNEKMIDGSMLTDEQFRLMQYFLLSIKK